MLFLWDSLVLLCIPSPKSYCLNKRVDWPLKIQLSYQLGENILKNWGPVLQGSTHFELLSNISPMCILTGAGRKRGNENGSFHDCILQPTYKIFPPVTILLKLSGFQVLFSKVKELLPHRYIEILHWIGSLIQGHFRCFMPLGICIRKRDTVLYWLTQLILIIKVYLDCCYTVV